MRTEGIVAALSLALLVSACSKRPEPTAALPDELKKDLAVASASVSQLATAPQSYQRMRFVSDIERTHASVPAARPKVSRHHEHTAPSAHALGNPVVSFASRTLQAVATPAAESPAPEPTLVVAARPAPEPMVAQPGGPSDAVVEEGHGGGLGALGGVIAGAVIRGGRSSTDKCDPRTDGRLNGSIRGRPDFAMPIPMTPPIFGGARRR